MIIDAKTNFVYFSELLNSETSYSETCNRIIGILDNLIILPVFEVQGNMDQKVIDLFKSVFPDKKIEPININPIAKEGGLMNCISWNIKI